MKHFLVTFVAFLLLTSSGWGMGEKPPVDDFVLPDLDGKPVMLSDHRGKVILLNFWASWCPPCREEMPSLQKLYIKLKGRQFQLLTISLDDDNPGAIKAFMRKNGYSFKVLHDRNGEVASRYQIHAIPTTFLLDKKGKIVERTVGSRDWSEPGMVKKIIALTGVEPVFRP